MGFRFRLHDKNLPGKPDIVFRSRSSVIFVNGCFWHRHKGCRRATVPSTRQDFWIPKLERNVERDRQTGSQLRRTGWRVLTVWECEIRDTPKLESKLRKFLNGA
jgi:DNA mismatch endonuclease (patch repair protein)